MHRLTLLVAITALAFVPGPARADDVEEALRALHPQYVPAPQLVALQSGCKSLSQATAEVRRRTGGKIVSAETRVQGGREVHHIKVLTTDGKVRTHKVNGCRR